MVNHILEAHGKMIFARNEEIAEKIESPRKVFSLWVTGVRTGEMERENSE